MSNLRITEYKNYDVNNLRIGAPFIMHNIDTLKVMNIKTKSYTTDNECKLILNTPSGVKSNIVRSFNKYINRLIFDMNNDDHKQFVETFKNIIEYCKKYLNGYNVERFHTYPILYNRNYVCINVKKISQTTFFDESKNNIPIENIIDKQFYGVFTITIPNIILINNKKAYINVDLVEANIEIETETIQQENSIQANNNQSYQQRSPMIQVNRPHPEGDDVEVGEGSESCVACYLNKPQILSSGCGHLCLCIGCSKKIYQGDNNKCPKCRKPWDNLIKVFQ